MKIIKVEGKADIITVDLISWIETHFEVSKWLGVILNQKELNSDGEINIKQAMENGGSWAVSDIAYDVTNEFEKEHLQTEWDVDADYWETLEIFLEKKFGKEPSVHS